MSRPLLVGSVSFGMWFYQDLVLSAGVCSDTTRVSDMFSLRVGTVGGSENTGRRVHPGSGGSR